MLLVWHHVSLSRSEPERFSLVGWLAESLVELIVGWHLDLVVATAEAALKVLESREDLILIILVVLGRWLLERSKW